MKCDGCGDPYPKYTMTLGPTVVPLPGGLSSISGDDWALCQYCHDALKTGAYGRVRANAVMNGTDVDASDKAKDTFRDTTEKVLRHLKSALDQGNASLDPLG